MEYSGDIIQNANVKTFYFYTNADLKKYKILQDDYSRKVCEFVIISESCILS